MFYKMLLKEKLSHLVKSVFKAPVPAYCILHISALSAQAEKKV